MFCRGRTWYQLAHDIMARQCQHWSPLGGPFFSFPQIGLENALSLYKVSISDTEYFLVTGVCWTLNYKHLLMRESSLSPESVQKGYKPWTMLQVLDRSKVKIWYIQVIHRLKRTTH